MEKVLEGPQIDRSQRPRHPLQGIESVAERLTHTDRSKKEQRHNSPFNTPSLL